jgi:hypothetical protein
MPPPCSQAAFWIMDRYFLLPQHDAEEWQAAMEAFLLVAERRGARPMAQKIPPKRTSFASFSEGTG